MFYRGLERDGARVDTVVGKAGNRFPYPNIVTEAFDPLDATVTLSALYSGGKDVAPANVRAGDQGYVDRLSDLPISPEAFERLARITRYVGVTDEFKNVIDHFNTPQGETPPGFRADLVMKEAGLLTVDLVRDIAYDKNARRRPTNLLYSVDSANPYEIRHFSDLVANLTCNPGIIYDLFINNPEANVGNKFKTRDEVMEEIGRILGPGVDISVELNNPFEEDFSKILEEAEKFREMLSPYRVVIKVPHTGPFNKDNIDQLLTGDGRAKEAYDEGATGDFVRGHNLALKLREHGFRINFTLMFDPHQVNLALQARPYFINAFIRHRLTQTGQLNEYLKNYEVTGDRTVLEQLRDFLIKADYLPPRDADMDLLAVKKTAEDYVNYREWNNHEGGDGLDHARHSLRALKNANLPDTRLILCSMQGFWQYKQIDKLLTEPEFIGMNDRVVLTTTPEYLAQQTSSNQVTSYQRRFMKAAQGQS